MNCVNDDFKGLFQDRDTVPTVGLIVEIENKSDNTLYIDTDKIKLAEDDNDPGDGPDPVLSDDFNDEIESGEH